MPWRYHLKFRVDAAVADPSGEPFDAALGLLAIGHLRGNSRQLRAFAGDDTTDQGGQRGQMSGHIPFGLTRIP